MSKQNAELKCDVCGKEVDGYYAYYCHPTGKCGHFDCVASIGKNPAPDWDKIKKLAQRMSGLVDEIEKEIESGE